MTTNIPQGWLRAPIGDLCRLQNGRAFKPTEWTTTGLPIVRIQNLNNPSAEFNRYIGNVEPRHLIDNGELLFAWSGTPGTSFGAHIWTGGPAVLNQHIFRVHNEEDIVERRFFRLALNERVQEMIRKSHGGVGLGHIKKGRFEETAVLVPPLNEQRRIVDKIDALFAHSKKAKESLDRIPALLEKLKRSILAAAFRGDLTKDWREAHPDVEPADVLLARIRAERRRRWEEAELARLTARGKVPGDDRWKERYEEARSQPAETPNNLPQLPVGWAWVRLDDVIETIESGTSPKCHGHPANPGQFGVLKVSAVSWGRFRPEENKALFEGQVPEPGTTVRAGDLLISRANTKELVGAVVLVREDQPTLMLSDKTLRLVPVPASVLGEYLLFALRTRRVRELYEADATGTSDSMRNLSQAKILSAVIPLPPLAEQAQIAAALGGGFDRITERLEDCLAAKTRLELLDGSILAKAFRGELVPQDPADEPASALLERIRAGREAPSASSDTPQKRPRTRRTAAAAPTPPTTPDDDPGLAPPPSIHAANPTSFIDLPRADQLPLVHAALRGVGPIPSDAAIRLVADHLRERHLANFSRLRSDGPLYAAIEKALDAAVRAELFDRPQRGHVRAIVSNPKDYTDADWRRCLEGALAERAESDPEPDEDDLIRAAAEWAVVNMGLVHQRLRSGGLVHQGLSRAFRVGVPAAANGTRPAP